MASDDWCQEREQLMERIAKLEQSIAVADALAEAVADEVKECNARPHCYVLPDSVGEKLSTYQASRGK